MFLLLGRKKTVTAEIGNERTNLTFSRSFSSGGDSMRATPFGNVRAHARKKAEFFCRPLARSPRHSSTTHARIDGARACTLCRIFPSRKKNWNNFRSFSTPNQFSRFENQVQKTVTK